MQAALHCGLEPPQTYFSENLETYVIERFDKTSDRKNWAMNNFTTLMKKSNGPNAKYTSSYETVLKAIHQFKLIKKFRHKVDFIRYERRLPGDSSQMDTCKLGPGLYKYTSIDDCARYRVLRDI
jgi:hypothetical protein